MNKLFGHLILKEPKPQHRFSRKISHLVTQKPWAVIVLGVLAAGAVKTQYTFELLSSFPEDRDSREGF